MFHQDLNLLLVAHSRDMFVTLICRLILFDNWFIRYASTTCVCTTVSKINKYSEIGSITVLTVFVLYYTQSLQARTENKLSEQINRTHLVNIILCSKLLNNNFQHNSIYQHLTRKNKFWQNKESESLFSNWATIPSKHIY